MHADTNLAGTLARAAVLALLGVGCGSKVSVGEFSRATETAGTGFDGSMPVVPVVDSGLSARLRPGCLPGTYTGDFHGSLAIVGIPTSDAQGTVRFTLEPVESSMRVELPDLRIGAGRVEGTARGGRASYSADFIGTVDCTELKLVDGGLINGTYFDPDYIVPFGFEGPVIASYDDISKSFVEGQWNVSDPTGVLNGTGVWFATLE